VSEKGGPRTRLETQGVAVLRATIVHELKQRLVRGLGLKVTIAATVAFDHIKPDDRIKKTATREYVLEPDYQIVRANTVDAVVGRLLEHLTDRIDKFQNAEEGSWLRAHSIQGVQIRSLRYTPFAGRRYLPSPAWLKAPRMSSAVVNIQNDDEECFKWAVLAAEFLRENPHKLTNFDDFLKYFIFILIS
jgi:hypothetical protein